MKQKHHFSKKEYDNILQDMVRAGLMEIGPDDGHKDGPPIAVTEKGKLFLEEKRRAHKMAQSKYWNDLMDHYLLDELLRLDKEYKSKGRDLESEGVKENELKFRVWHRLLADHPELEYMCEEFMRKK